MNKTFYILAITLGLALMGCSTTSKVSKNTTLETSVNIKPLKLTSTNFDDVVSEGVTVVDLWATWCGPCKTIAPIIDELAVDYNNNEEVKIAKLDIDKNKDIPKRYNVSAIPTILFFRNGALVDTHVGETSKGVIVRKIDSIQD